MKTAFITGGTGTYGNELTKQLLATNEYDKIIVYSRDEYKQAVMNEKFNSDKRLRFYLGDVRDLQRLTLAMESISESDESYVFHAAALKRVDSCEYSLFETINTNVIGSYNVIQAALKANVLSVLAISSDKATEPCNLYGATKLTMEKMFTAANMYASNKKTRFASLRYGNVINSRGSVIPMFKEQFKKDETVFITDPEMTRFFISIEDAVAFSRIVMQNMNGGEVFVPKMKSISILKLAEIITGSNKYEVVGLRPGEKLHESLISQTEVLNTIDYGDYYIIKPVKHSYWSLPDIYSDFPLVNFKSYNSLENTLTFDPKKLKEMANKSS